MASSRNARLLAGIVAAPIVFAALYTGFRLVQSARLASRSKPLQVAPPEPRKRLLIVGDSTGVGTGASTPQTSLAGLIAAEHPNLAIVNRSTDGATVDRIAAQLEGGGRFDAVLILGGGNDLIRMTGAEALRAALSRVLFLARAAPRPEGTEPRIEWYEADHAMRSPKARAARRRFLGEQLGLE